MSKSKFTDELKRILEDKKLRNLLVICLVSVFFLLALNVFQNSSGLSGKVASITNKGGNYNNTNSGNNNGDNKIITEEDYETKQKVELKNILKKINGVGDVDVMITFENGEEKVPAYDNTEQKAITEETDNQGGKRVNNQNTDSSKVVMKNSDGKNEPFILTTMKPKIVGIIVVAEGAENSKTKYEIEQAVSKLYNLSLDKINVLSMKK